MAHLLTAPFPYRDDLGEGPVWDVSSGCLLRVDYLAHAVHHLDVRTGDQTTTLLPEPVSFAVPLDESRLLAGLPSSVQVVDRDGKSLETVATLEHQDGVRLNDAKIDPAGRLVFGTLSEHREAVGSCFVLDGRPVSIVDAVTISNGLGWDEARERFYFVDSWTWRIDVMDWDASTSTPSDRRTFATVDPADGMPDGLCVDSEGCVWVALFGGSRVRRYLPDGSIERELALPVTHPTSVAFGGEALATLFITSSRHRLTPEQRRAQDLAGALFVHEPGVTGHLPFIPREIA